MNKEEKKEYLNNIFQLVLSGEENFELADSLIESLNLHDDFVNHAEKEIKVLRAKRSFIIKNSLKQNFKKLLPLNKKMNVLNYFLHTQKKSPNTRKGLNLKLNLIN